MEEYDVTWQSAVSPLISFTFYLIDLGKSIIEMEGRRRQVTEGYNEKYRLWNFPGGASDKKKKKKKKACQCRRQRKHSFNSWIRQIPWRTAWQPTQYSCLENPMDGGPSQATVHRVTESQTQLKQLSRHATY